MSNFYNEQYLSERLAAVCKERDELNREVSALRQEIADLKEIVWRQVRLNRSCAVMAMELDQVKAERDALLDEIRGMCNLCKHYEKGDGDSVCVMCAWDKNWEWRGTEDK